jgi:hypothetical protein
VARLVEHRACALRGVQPGRGLALGRDAALGVVAGRCWCPALEVVAGLYVEEDIRPAGPSAAEAAVARAALAAVPGGGERLFDARVDLVPGPGGEPVVLELELLEPSLFLTHAPGAAGRLAAAIAGRLSERPSAPA